MSFISNIWNSAVLGAKHGVKYATYHSSGIGTRFVNHGDTLQYRIHRTYKSRLVQELSRVAIQSAINEVNQLYPNYIKKLQKQKRQDAIDFQQKNQQILIQNQQIQTSQGFGRVRDTKASCDIIAADKYGEPVAEALMLWYEGDESIDAAQYYENTAKAKKEEEDTTATTKTQVSFQTKIICHIDLVPQVSLSSSKNVVLTPVQGRDYTRKELVSGGDLQFSVSGEIMSHQPGVYPEPAVQKFMKAMRYGGLLNVHHFLFAQYGVTRVLIKDFNLPAPEYKNIQPYSFNCVAVEPDEEIVLQDTIQALDDEFDDHDDFKSWQKLIVNEKFANATQNTLSDIMNNTISSLVDLIPGRI